MTKLLSIPVIVFATFFLTAPLAQSAICRVVNVVSSEFVPGRAVCFTVQKPRSDIIFRLSDRFQMKRVDASSISAKMINMKIFWDGTFCQSIAKSVRPFFLFFGDIKFSVPLIFAADPLPTGVKRNKLNVSKKSFFQCFQRWEVLRDIVS